MSYVYKRECLLHVIVAVTWTFTLSRPGFFLVFLDLGWGREGGGILDPPSWISGFPQNFRKNTEIERKVIKTIKEILKFDLKTQKLL